MSAAGLSTLVKTPTGLAGLDLLTYGGLPQGRTCLVTGSAGSAKTVFAAQFLAEGIRKCNETGVFVTFEESPDDIRRNMVGLGMDIASWETQGKWIFVDASMRPDEDGTVAMLDIPDLIKQIEEAVHKVKANRVVVDSLGAVFSKFADSSVVRQELFRVAWAMRALGVTSLMTAERAEHDSEISRHGIEEFVVDNVIILRNSLEMERRRRTIEVLKLRGTPHQKGEFPFTILPGEGIVIVPVSSLELTQKSTSTRVSSGNDAIDKMCGGGYFRDSILLVSGATGTGKTLMVTEFLGSAAKEKDGRALVFAFEESREQLFRNAGGWGHNFEALESQGKLKVVCEFPESAGLEDHLVRLRDVIEDYKPTRVAIDSLSALERVANLRGFREFVISITAYLKQKQITGMFTSTTPHLIGGASITEAHFSTITDTIILLRYVEIFGQMRRGVTVLKMRGSMHDKDIREFTIDGQGMHVGKPFRNVSGILSGTPVHTRLEEIDRMDELFQEP